jgi:hypothetical protein
MITPLHAPTQTSGGGNPVGSSGVGGDPADPQAVAYTIAGQTLSAGEPAVKVHNTAISLLPGGSSVVLDRTKTIALAAFLQSQLATAGNGPGSGAEEEEVLISQTLKPCSEPRWMGLC